MRRTADAVTAFLARTLVRIYFRSVEVAGGHHVPATGPLVEVANHQNGLVDGLVLIAASRRYPRFLGKSTLWKIVPLRPFLALAGVVPVYRGADAEPGVADAGRAERNRAALARSSRLLAEGGTVGVFPEGISHDLASLQDLRTGAARLALGAAAGAGAGGTAGGPVQVVPVGIVYDDKTRFRSRVAVRFGPPRSVDPYLAAGTDERDAVRHLTADLAADLRAVGPDYDSVEAADRFGRLAAVAADTVTERERLARRLAALAGGSGPGRAGVEDLERRSDHYEAGLRRLGLDDAGLRAAAGAPGGRIPRRALGPLPDLLALPLAGVGVAVHAAPYAVIAALGSRPTNLGMRSTVKLLGSFGLYNLTYLGLAGVVGRRRGWRAGLVALVLAPTSGWVALRTLEEAEELGGLQRAALVVSRRRAAAERLLAERAELVARLRRLLDTAGPEEPGTTPADAGGPPDASDAAATAATGDGVDPVSSRTPL